VANPDTTVNERPFRNYQRNLHLPPGASKATPLVELWKYLHLPPGASKATPLVELWK